SANLRETTYDGLRHIAERWTIPLAVGGGVCFVADVDLLLGAGADKVSFGTAAVTRPDLVDEVADRFGSQVLVVSVDARRTPRSPSGFEVTTHGGRRPTGLDAADWIRHVCERGAGEVLLNSMDADGSGAGFDLELIVAVREVTTVPLVASGGAGAAAHFPPAIAAGADAVLAAGIFHRGEVSIRAAKAALRAAGHRVRPAPP
ncbi:MAG: imidazole glycerol phosphate synthase subunit HisF, partial [Nocardioidaceae bacterium]